MRERKILNINNISLNYPKYKIKIQKLARSYTKIKINASIIRILVWRREKIGIIRDDVYFDENVARVAANMI